MNCSLNRSLAVPARFLLLAAWYLSPVGLESSAPTLFAQDASFKDRAAGNWHQWRGPLATGVAPHANPPLTWNGSDGQHIRWKTAIPGRGSSSPVVWEDRIFLQTAIEGPGSEEGTRGPVQFCVVCVNRQDGSIAWQKTVHEEQPHESLHSTNTFASASPVVDGERIYASFGSFGVYCLDWDGDVVWERQLGKMRTRNEFGEGASPALYNDTLIVPWDHEGPSFLVALDAATGKQRWKQDRDEVTTWNTPLVVETQRGPVVVINASNRARGYDLKTGSIVWECGGQVTNPIPCPMADDQLVFCMSGHRGAAIYAISLEAQGDVTNTSQIAWSRDEAAPYVPSAILYDSRLYFVKRNSGVLSCLDARTGEPLIDQKRLPELDNVYASPVGAQDRIYFTGRDGVTAVIKRSDTLEVLAINRLGEPVDASPALVDGEMFLRGESHLYCIAE
ncbi:MAG: PQQ-binding-like beta-propeller repeat protein [Planctomycetales bacterium]|nr:PQQ-binding-like beta-propeller repeat protein [Planctomycetales bacterium]